MPLLLLTANVSPHPRLTGLLSHWQVLQLAPARQSIRTLRPLRVQHRLCCPPDLLRWTTVALHPAQGRIRRLLSCMLDPLTILLLPSQPQLNIFPSADLLRRFLPAASLSLPHPTLLPQLMGKLRHLHCLLLHVLIDQPLKLPCLISRGCSPHQCILQDHFHCNLSPASLSLL